MRPGCQRGDKFTNALGSVIGEVGVIGGCKRPVVFQAIAPCSPAEGPFCGNVQVIGIIGIDQIFQASIWTRHKLDFLIARHRKMNKKIAGTHDMDGVAEGAEFQAQIFICSDNSVDLRIPRIGDNQDSHAPKGLFLLMKQPYTVFMIKTRARLLFLATIMWIAWPAPVMAQDCQIQKNTITPFRSPEYGTALVWKTVIGEKGHEQFADGVALPDGDMILGGGYTDPKEESVYRPYLVRMEARGKIVWEIRDTSKTPQTIDKMVMVDNEIVTLGTMEGADAKTKKIVLTRYNTDGKKLGGFVLDEEGGHLEPSAVAVVKDGYYVAARYESQRDNTQRFGVVYKLDRQGGRLWRRAYIPGLISTVDTMSVTRRGDLLLGGSVIDERGRKVAWIVRADSDGGIQWQRSYPRGRAAIFTHSIEAQDGTGYIMAGTGWPIGADRSGALVMKVDTAGNTLWERYYTSAYDYNAHDLGLLEDGRIVVAVDAAPPGEINEEILPHLRLIMLSPRGQLLNTDSYTDGHGLFVNRIWLGQGAPRMIGMIRTGSADANGQKTAGTFDAWIGELQSLGSYTDPCLPK